MKALNGFTSLPIYIKYFFLLSNALLTLYILKVASPLINPLLVACVVAVIVKPVCLRLEKFHVPRILSSILCIIFLCIFIFALVAFFTAQISAIAETLPSMGARFSSFMNHTQTFIADIFNIPTSTLNTYMNNSTKEFMQHSGAVAQGALTLTASLATSILLFVITLFFFLYYRNFFLTFIFKMFDKSNHESVTDNITQINGAIKDYLVGLAMVIGIISVLNTLGLMAVGLDHALFFGIFGAFLTLIPYIGIIIGSLLPTCYALAMSQTLWYPFTVIMIFSLIQFLEGNIITPNIIGNKVNINPFVAFIGLFVGGEILGVTGVILAIPLIGIIKILCENFDSLQAIGYLIGNPPPAAITKVSKK